MTRFTVIIAVVLLGAVGCSTTYDFDPVTVGGEDGNREPKAKTSAQFLRSVYADLLGRAPEQYDFSVKYNGVEQYTFPIDEQDELVAAQDAVGDPVSIRSRLVAAIVSSAAVGLPEKSAVADPSEFITDEFRTLLGRDPSPYELARFVSEWNGDPAVGPRAVVRALIGSREYQSQ
jgi:hypothetical protein